MNEGKMPISDEMWNKETPVFKAVWGEGIFTINCAFDTDTVTLHRNEAIRLREALNKFLEFPAIQPG